MARVSDEQLIAWETQLSGELDTDNLVALMLAGIIRRLIAEVWLCRAKDGQTCETCGNWWQDDSMFDAEDGMGTCEMMHRTWTQQDSYCSAWQAKEVDDGAGDGRLAGSLGSVL